MNAAPGLPRPPGLRGPGLAWLPPVLRQRSTWRTVWRFAWAGPLIGCLPYIWMLVSVPFAYVIGALPATVAGLLFAAWYHGQRGRAPSWPWRAVVGALAGVGAVAAALLGMLAWQGRIEWFLAAVLAVHGVPAALVLALLHKPVPGTPATRA